MTIATILLLVLGAIVAWLVTRWLNQRYGDGTAASESRGRRRRAPDEHETQLLAGGAPDGGDGAARLQVQQGGLRLAQPGLAPGAFYVDAAGRAAVNRYR